MEPVIWVSLGPCVRTTTKRSEAGLPWPPGLAQKAPQALIQARAPSSVLGGLLQAPRTTLTCTQLPGKGLLLIWAGWVLGEGDSILGKEGVRRQENMRAY